MIRPQDVINSLKKASEWILVSCLWLFLTFDTQTYIQTGEQRHHCHRTNVCPFTGHLGEGECIRNIPTCEALQPNPRPLILPWAAVVTEESGSLSSTLPVPLYGDVWSLVVNGKLAVDLLLGPQAYFHWWRLCFYHHGSYKSKSDGRGT